MKTRILLPFLLLGMLTATAKDYYIAPSGDDSAAGTIDAPFRTLVPAQKLAKPGDTIYFRGGTYTPVVEESMGERSIYSCAYLLDKSGEEGNPIRYFAYPDERPVFDLSNYKPEGKRVSVFYVSGSWLHLKGLEVIGTQVTIADGSNTQSECFSNRGGSHNIYEQLKMHDGMGIGFYLVKGGDNLVLNCDAWNNYDALNGGGNVDGFGCHPSKGDTGNVLRGCRSWWNSDDGFDLIHSAEPVRIEQCWAFYNGYRPETFQSAADGNGIKAGGYGMSENSKIAEVIPVHEVVDCLAYRNKAGGLYANHHLGGITWINNTAARNRWNYNMVNRKSAEEPVDVDGYGHFLANNVSYNPREADCVHLDLALSTQLNNTFGPAQLTLGDADFRSVDDTELVLPRNADGSLPTIGFLQPAESSPVSTLQMGYSFAAPTKEELLAGEGDGTEWLMAPTLVVEGDEAWIEGPDADKFNALYANGEKLKISKGKVNLSSLPAGEIALKATLSNGIVITRKIQRP